MVIIVWRDMNTYQGAMYSVNDDSRSCNLFHFNYFAGRIYSEIYMQNRDSAAK